eukprot:1929767-Lingulodinium_polyedra.AAC.1
MAVRQMNLQPGRRPFWAKTVSAQTVSAQSRFGPRLFRPETVPARDRFGPDRLGPRPFRPQT